MNTESDTPRTEIVLQKCNQDATKVGIADLAKMHEHAQELERELNEMRKDLKNALHWIDDGVDQEGRDLIVNPMRAKYFSDEKLTN